VVCDGMGGMEHGDLAGKTAVRTFLDAYARKTPEEAVPAALDRSVREANARVVALAHSLGRAEGIGTTLVAATLLDGGPGQARLYWVSVGDSGLFHVTSGQMRMVNYPHVFANHLDQAVARGALTAEAAMMHPERESLTSFIGAEVLEEIDLTPEPLLLAEGDTILLASDGMFKTLSPAEIAANLTGHPQEWPEILVQQTLLRRRESQDNVTVLSVTVEGEPVNVSAVSGSFVRAGEFTAAPAEDPRQLAQTMRLPAQEDAHDAASIIATPAPTIPMQAMLPPLEPVASAPAPARMGGHSWTWVLALILLLGAGGGGWWYWSHSRAASTGLRRPEPAADRTPPAAPSYDPNQPIPAPDPNAPDPFQHPGKSPGVTK
jgi:serine/threonine protein phosphatase PrpC